MSEGIIMKSDGNKTLAQIQAEVAAFEANPIAPNAPDIHTPPAVNAPAPVATPEKAALPEPGKTPPVTEPAKPTQQPKEVAEKVASETPKAAEPVKEQKDWKAAYEGLQRSYNKRFVEDKKVETAPAEKPPVPPTLPPTLGEITPEIAKMLETESEKNPWKAVDDLIRLRLGQVVTPVASRLQSLDAEREGQARAESFRVLVQDEGHEWLQTEDGFAKVAAVWEKYPELRNTPDPVRSALGYIPNIPSNAQQRGPAQSTGLTPILGASGAVPPVTSTPAASKVDKLATMLTEVQRLQSLGAVQESRNLLAEMDKIERGI